MFAVLCWFDCRRERASQGDDLGGYLWITHVWDEALVSRDGRRVNWIRGRWRIRTDACMGCGVVRVREEPRMSWPPEMAPTSHPPKLFPGSFKALFCIVFSLSLCCDSYYSPYHSLRVSYSLYFFLQTVWLQELFFFFFLSRVPDTAST